MYGLILETKIEAPCPVSTSREADILNSQTYIFAVHSLNRVLNSFIFSICSTYSSKEWFRQGGRDGEGVGQGEIGMMYRNFIERVAKRKNERKK